MRLERLHKVMAQAGVASRRKCEHLILEGRVKVNGQVVQTLGAKVDPSEDKIEVNGKALQFTAERLYILLNKPAGYLTTMMDPFNRPTIVDLIEEETRVFPVGRLDRESEGLLLLTNDGELAYRLTHPRYKVEKTYLVEVRGHPEETILRMLRRGVVLEDGLTASAKVDVLERGRESTVVEITIWEGRKRQVRRMFEKVGHPVIRLRRISLGPIELGYLPPGRYRFLHPSEIKALRKTIGLK
ncbi:MAG: pseudouridine synthase [Actinomycetota bacterium]|nr:pseudouridine synthase [Actinomycetota bacterium]